MSGPDPIPDAWPPEDGNTGESVPEGATSTVPIFPLPGVFLFPQQLLPLHIFEERYRQMMDDSLDGPGRIAIATIPTSLKDQQPGDPDVLPVAGLGEIARHEKLPDGRYLIWLIGLARVAIEEVENDRLYRTAKARIVQEKPILNSEADSLRPRLVEAINTRAGKHAELSDQIPVGVLADLLLQCLPTTPELLETLYSESDVGIRAQHALQAHQDLPQNKPNKDNDASN